jgi:hypothetical protein
MFQRPREVKAGRFLSKLLSQATTLGMRRQAAAFNLKTRAVTRYAIRRRAPFINYLQLAIME